jgi:hypothetical protein
MNTSTIAIPPSYFIKAVQGEYSDYQGAFWRELFQNSLDAGATQIDIEIDEEGCSFSDNGSGMDRPTVIDGMLTLGGTVKGEDAVGGFGQAKNLITLCHSQYQIRSQDWIVEGSSIHYQMTDVPEFYNGTKIVVVACAEFNWSKATMKSKLESLLNHSDIKAQVTINGQDASWRRTSATKLVNLHEVAGAAPEWCQLYSEESSHETSTVDVRINGLFMFYVYLGTNIKKHLILELTGATRKYLTSNRDGLKYQYSNGLSNMLSYVRNNKKTFDKQKQRQWSFRGQKGEIFTRIHKILKDVAEMIPGIVWEKDETEIAELVFAKTTETGNFSAALVTNHIVDMVKNDQEWRDLSPAVIGLMEVKILEQVQELNTVILEHDLRIDLSDSIYEEIPKRYYPGTFSVRVERILKYWKHALATVNQINGLEEEYTIGITLDSSLDGARQVVDGHVVYWINPDSTSYDYTKSKHLAKAIMQVAAHEIAHRFVGPHCDAFCLKSERLFLNVLFEVENFAQWAKEAEQVKI